MARKSRDLFFLRNDRSQDATKVAQTSESALVQIFKLHSDLSGLLAGCRSGSCYLLNAIGTAFNESLGQRLRIRRNPEESGLKARSTAATASIITRAKH
jgi:hypothetical protein